PRIADPEWARQEGMVAFAGYPLKVDDRLLGVMAVFARAPFSAAAGERMAAIAGTIARGLERRRREDERSERLAREEGVRTGAEPRGVPHHARARAPASARRDPRRAGGVR